MLQTDGIEAIQKIADIKYLHKREFITYKREEIDLYLKGRAQCVQGKKGCIDHGIIGGLLLYDRLRKQFEVSWGCRSKKSDSRDLFYINDNENSRTLYLSNAHYVAYARAADAIMTHNIYCNTFNDYVKKLDTTRRIKERTENTRISMENCLCFILAIADTIEPIKRDLKLTDIMIEDLPNKGIRIAVKSGESTYTKNIKELQEWIDIKVVELASDNGSEVFALSLPSEPLKKSL